MSSFMCESRLFTPVLTRSQFPVSAYSGLLRHPILLPFLPLCCHGDTDSSSCFYWPLVQFCRNQLWICWKCLIWFQVMIKAHQLSKECVLVSTHTLKQKQNWSFWFKNVYLRTHSSECKLERWTVSGTWSRVDSNPVQFDKVWSRKCPITILKLGWCSLAWRVLIVKITETEDWL